MSQAAAVVAGSGFAMFYLTFSTISRQAGMWPLIATQASAMAVLVAVMLATQAAGRPLARLELDLDIIAAALLYVAAQACYLLATRWGPPVTVVPIASLYPAGTVALAGLLLGEPLDWRHAAAFMLAAVAIVLLATN